MLVSFLYAFLISNIFVSSFSHILKTNSHLMSLNKVLREYILGESTFIKLNILILYMHIYNLHGSIRQIPSALILVVDYLDL